MVVGSFVVTVCLLVLGWTSEIVSVFVKDTEKVWSSRVKLCECLGYEYSLGFHPVRPKTRRLPWQFSVSTP